MKKRTAPRIIGGKFKGKRLKSLPGNQTRPITDRVKENLFNIIGNDIWDSNFLDAFAGTGSVGIEALSRGAKFVQFIEKNQKPYTILKENLDGLCAGDSLNLKQCDAFNYLSSSSEQVFEYIYIAPPQYQNMWTNAINRVDKNSKILENNGWMIVQIDPIEYEPFKLESFVEFDQRKYGSTLLVFLNHTN